ncbi:hypothetical protein SAMCFNEI73_Ch2589 [Sinorhizobium americanum]|uniref:Uncharacterized protein n=1 Tax=Sinorhizobium americanum TaxID=194963 RepID=A0A1L3LP61_9HYPH|nr:hypothetical protein SAMCFNEI73_Ch2589 [Sinorhizobium americanum]
MRFSRLSQRFSNGDTRLWKGLQRYHDSGTEASPLGRQLERWRCCVVAVARHEAGEPVEYVHGSSVCVQSQLRVT